ncbi:hypothetical protein LINGRAHAP2_LOCUS12132 [Linum grandiflorum]
MQVW